jgi:ribosome maturation factor RimP
MELIELKVGRHKQDVFIQVLADKISGGINLEECSSLNRLIVESVDKMNIFSEDGYSLEVSSPGLDRPLSTYRDFLRNINGEARVLLKEKINGKGEYLGVVKSADQNAVCLVLPNKEELIVPMSHLLKGFLVI